MPFPVSKRYENRFHNKMRDRSIFNLNITTLLDLFIIIIFFLLETFTTDGKIPPVSSQLVIPKSMSVDLIQNYGVVIHITHDQLYCQNKPICSLERIKSSSALKIDSLFFVLNERYDQMNNLMQDKNISQTEFRDLKGLLTIVGDRNTSYGVLKKIIYTSYLSGFNNIFLATEQTAGSNEIDLH